MRQVLCALALFSLAPSLIAEEWQGRVEVVPVLSQKLKTGSVPRRVGVREGQVYVIFEVEKEDSPNQFEILWKDLALSTVGQNSIEGSMGKMYLGQTRNGCLPITYSGAIRVYHLDPEVKWHDAGTYDLYPHSMVGAQQFRAYSADSNCQVAAAFSSRRNQGSVTLLRNNVEARITEIGRDDIVAAFALGIDPQNSNMVGFGLKREDGRHRQAPMIFYPDGVSGILRTNGLSGEAQYLNRDFIFGGSFGRGQGSCYSPCNLLLWRMIEEDGQKSVSPPLDLELLARPVALERFGFKDRSLIRDVTLVQPDTEFVSLALLIARTKNSCHLRFPEISDHWKDLGPTISKEEEIFAGACLSAVVEGDNLYLLRRGEEDYAILTRYKLKPNKDIPFRSILKS